MQALIDNLTGKFTRFDIRYKKITRYSYGFNVICRVKGGKNISVKALTLVEALERAVIMANLQGIKVRVDLPLPLRKRGNPTGG